MKKILFMVTLLLTACGGIGYSHVCDADYNGCFDRYRFDCGPDTFPCDEDGRCDCDAFCTSKDKTVVSYAGNPVSLGNRCICSCE